MAANAGDKKKEVYKVKAIDMDAQIPYKDASKGNYAGVELIYEREYQGQKKTETKNFVGKSLDHPANGAMKAALGSLGKGDLFTVGMEFDGTYWNWKEVTKGGQVVEHPAAASRPATSGKPAGNSYPPKKDVVSADNLSGLSDYELGITCGMALNNSVAILGKGAKLEEVEDLAYKFVKLAINFKENVRAGVFSRDQVKPEVATAKSQKAVDMREDVPPATDWEDDIPFS